MQVAHAPGMPGTFSPAADFKENRLLAIPACITARASRTCRDACRDRLHAVTGKTFPAFPAHAHPQFTYLARGPWSWDNHQIDPFQLISLERRGQIHQMDNLNHPSLYNHIKAACQHVWHARYAFLTFWGSNMIFLGYFFSSTNTKAIFWGIKTTNPYRIRSFWPQIPFSPLLGSNIQWPMAQPHRFSDRVHPHPHPQPPPTPHPPHLRPPFPMVIKYTLNQFVWQLIINNALHSPLFHWEFYFYRTQTIGTP